MVSPPDRITVGLPACLARSSAWRACAAPSSRASPSRLSPSITTSRPRSLASGGGGLERALGRGDHDRLDPRQPGIAGLRRLLDLPAAPFFEMRRARPPAARCGTWRAPPGASAKVVRSGTVGPEPITPGSSLGTSEISHDQHARRLGGDGEASALDGREMLPHRVHLDDVGARLQQRAIDLLLVGQREAGRGQRQQRRGAAGDQAQHEVVRGQSLHLVEDATARRRGPSRRAPDAPPRRSRSSCRLSP